MFIITQHIAKLSAKEGKFLNLGPSMTQHSPEDQMLKIAGRIITQSAAEDWRKAHPKVKPEGLDHPTSLNVEAFLYGRRKLEKIPFKIKNVVQVSWPKVVTDLHFLEPFLTLPSR